MCYGGGTVRQPTVLTHLKIRKPTCAHVFVKKSHLTSNFKKIVSLKMASKRTFRIAPKGKDRLKSLNLSQVEVDTVRLALHGCLGAEIKKRGKITKQVLCETMEKIIPLCSAIFVEMVPAEGANQEVVDRDSEEADRQLKEDLEAAISTGARAAPIDGHEAAVTDSEETVCKFYKVGKCKFGKKGEQAATCRKVHPPPCRAFDDKGPEGCKSDPCPKGKFHRTVCAKLIAGECNKKQGNCSLYHPPKLSQKIKARLTKKKEEEERRELSQMLAELRSLKQPQLVQFPHPFYTMPQPVPTPTNCGKKSSCCSCHP